MYAHIMVFKNAWQNDFENMLWRCFYKQSVNEKKNHSFNQMFFYECWEKKNNSLNCEQQWALYMLADRRADVATVGFHSF